jgi:hypothetical protein
MLRQPSLCFHVLELRKAHGGVNGLGSGGTACAPLLLLSPLPVTPVVVPGLRILHACSAASHQIEPGARPTATAPGGEPPASNPRNEAHDKQCTFLTRLCISASTLEDDAVPGWGIC